MFSSTQDILRKRACDRYSISVCLSQFWQSPNDTSSGPARDLARRASFLAASTVTQAIIRS